MFIVLSNAHFYHELIGWTNLLSSLLSFYNPGILIIKHLKVTNFIQTFLLWVNFRAKLYFKLLSFGVLVFIWASLVVELFVHVDRIRVHWSWNLSLSVIENNWAVSKNANTNLIPPQVCVKSWQGYRSSVTDFWF